ncbi:MAG: SDR family NAD(P)-dependent oxidoreductase [Verrucomicrobiota bacterium]
MADATRQIILTGLTSGCGRALFHELDAAGHTVFGCARSADKLRALAKAYRPDHRLTPVDVSDHAAVEAWAADILETAGPPDLVINNAALMNEARPLWEVPAEEFNELIAVNVGGTAHVMRAFLPAMIERGRGVIVNFSSGWGRSTSPEVAPYCASKFAVEGLSAAVAQEVPRGLAVIALNPGVINTPMLQKCWSDAAHAYPDPEKWARNATPYILGLSAKDNGRALSVA